METTLLSLIGFSVAMYITPGPNNVMVAASAANHGIGATTPHMEALRINDFNEAKEIWRERDKQASELAQMGRASEEVMTVNIERVREQMRAVGATSRIKGPVTLDQVYDFSFVKKAYDDIRASKFDPMRYEYSKR